MTSLLARLTGPVGTVMRRIMGEGEGAKPAATLARRSVPDAPIVEDSFRLSLQQMQAEDEGRFSTKLHIVSLVEFREAVGDKWGRLSTKVLMIAEAVIGLHLGAGNTFGREGQDTFILIFRTCPPAEARRRAVTIAQDLGARLLGSQFDGGDRPLALAAEVSLADALNPDGSLNPAAVALAVDEIRSLVPPPAPKPRHSPLPAGASAQSAPAASPEFVEISHSPLPSEPMKLEPVALPAGLKGAAVDPAWKAMQGAARSKDDPAWQTMSARAAAPAETEPAGESAPPLPPGAVLSLVWRPAWVAAGEAIGAYKARVNRVDAEGQPPYEGAKAYPRDNPASALALDRFVATRALADMGAAERAGNRAALILPLHWASAVSAQRMAVTAPFAEVSQEARAARLVVEIFGLPADVGARELADCVRNFKALGREVALRTRLSAPKAALAADCGAVIIGVDLAELSESERTDDDQLLARLLAYREAADKAGLRACVWGVRRRKVMVGAVHGGFAMTNGPALMKDLPKPAKVLPAPKNRFTHA